jgi:hypothetical protein
LLQKSNPKPLLPSPFKGSSRKKKWWTGVFEVLSGRLHSQGRERFLLWSLAKVADLHLLRCTSRLLWESLIQR